MRDASDSRPADDGGATDSVKRSPVNNARCVCLSGPEDGGGCSRTEVMCPPQVVRDPSEPPSQCSVSGSLNCEKASNELYLKTAKHPMQWDAHLCACAVGLHGRRRT